MLISELFYAVWRKISVESGATNLELVDHIADEGVVLAHSLKKGSVALTKAS